MVVSQEQELSSSSEPRTTSSETENYVAPTALLKPRAIPIWAENSTEHLQQQEYTTFLSSNDLDRQTSSTKDSSNFDNEINSPILAATKTTIPLSQLILDPDKTRWKQFASHSQLPDQKRTQNSLLLHDAPDIDNHHAVLSSNASLQNGKIGSIPLQTQIDETYMHQKHRIISISDLEEQMDLSGSWNPSREHSTGVVARLGDALALPAVPQTARHQHSENNAGTRERTRTLSAYSTTSVASQFHMTAELTEKHRKGNWKLNFRVLLLDNPYVPLTLRSAIFVISLGALGLAVSVYRLSKNLSPEPLVQQPSTIMAICVQSIALVYLVYITYDEYSGKPLGLRDAKDKVKLIMLDVLFIILSSANLSLTFNTLYDKQWICRSDDIIIQDDNDLPYNGPICRRQRGLAAFLFMVLLMWLMTFTISIFRVVERVSGGSGLI
ncbi:hypothetical protein V1514DRAFT_338335 [Lipomyces japonicus]|uniref:uncharacterized protein n=1 Tax=Lipomyces japonicus TaxID=56871 RepID=UPI0034CE2477